MDPHNISKDIDPDELFKDTSDVRESETYICTSNECYRGSSCDGNHSYSEEVLRARKIGIYAYDESTVEGSFTAPIVRDLDEGADKSSSMRSEKKENKRPIEISPKKIDVAGKVTQKSPLKKNCDEGNKFEEKKDDNFAVDGDVFGDDYDYDFASSQS